MDREAEEVIGEDFKYVEVLPPQEMLAQLAGINIAAPMVRFSKLPYRHLVSLYNTHITYTPMILAQEFSRSAIGRRSDFTTSIWERGIFDLPETHFPPSPSSPFEPSLALETNHSALHSGLDASIDGQDDDDDAQPKGRTRRVRGVLIAQFAANDTKIFADASELIHPHVDGIDLNLGCPQKWAYAEKIGSYLLREPGTVRDLIRAARDRTGWNTPISIKIRLDAELKRTEKLVRTAVEAGASYIAVHGRTRHQPSTHPVDVDGIRFARECARGEVPIVANGDAWSYAESENIREKTGVQGVMSGRGLLANPGLFAGYDRTPIDAVSNFVQLSTKYGVLPFPLFHRHLGFMLEDRFASRVERSYFLSDLVSYAAVVDWLEEKGVALNGGDEQLWDRRVQCASYVSSSVLKCGVNSPASLSESHSLF